MYKFIYKKYKIKKDNLKLISFNNYNIAINIQKEMSNREVSCGKLVNPHFLGVIGFMSFNYFIFVV